MRLWRAIGTRARAADERGAEFPFGCGQRFCPGGLTSELLRVAIVEILANQTEGCRRLQRAFRLEIDDRLVEFENVDDYFENDGECFLERMELEHVLCNAILALELTHFQPQFASPLPHLLFEMLIQFGEVASQGGALEVGAQAGQDFVLVERLCHVVDATRGKPFDNPLDIVPRRQKNNRNRRQGFTRLQLAAGLVAVHLRHHHVEEDDVGARMIGYFQGGRTIRCHVHIVALAVEGPYQDVEIGRHIIDDQDLASSEIHIDGVTHIGSSPHRFVAFGV